MSFSVFQIRIPPILNIYEIVKIYMALFSCEPLLILYKRIEGILICDSTVTNQYIIDALVGFVER